MVHVAEMGAAQTYERIKALLLSTEVLQTLSRNDAAQRVRDKADASQNLVSRIEQVQRKALDFHCQV